MFSDEKRKTLRTGAVPTLNLPVKSHASIKQSDDLPPRKYLTLNLDDKAKPTVPAVEYNPAVEYVSFFDEVLNLLAIYIPYHNVHTCKQTLHSLQ